MSELDFMKYYILKSNTYEEVSDEAYNGWHEKEAANLLLPDKEIIVEDHVHYLKSHYIGSVDNGEGLYPFVLIHSDDLIQNKKDSKKQVLFDDDTQYYETIELYTTAYNNLHRTLQEASQKTSSG